VGEIRRVLNSFLQFMERDDSDSLVVAATNCVGMLDDALFRRFDDVIQYELPDAAMVRSLVQNKLSSFIIETTDWRKTGQAAKGLSHAEVTRACDDAAKEAVLSGSKDISSETLLSAITRRRQIKAPPGVAGARKKSPRRPRGKSSK
jgi:SpoVK/Ycf46/Vps4 family AAA+-type ATPase